MILIISLLTEEICSILQGFIPLQLFMLFISDLDMEITEQQIIKKFADDIKIVHFIESSEDSVALQATLDKLGAWAVRWGMQFNTAKCHVMHIGKKNPKNVYMMNGGEGNQSDRQL